VSREGASCVSSARLHHTSEQEGDGGTAYGCASVPPLSEAADGVGLGKAAGSIESGRCIHSCH
jgi:hypothetical protein